MKAKPLRFAFSGFRHPHINTLYDLVENHPDCEIVGCAEEDPATSAELKKVGEIILTDPNLEALLANRGADVLAVGDTYGRRGQSAIAGLNAGLHVIADKPLCTELSALDEIRSIAQKKSLAVGLMLDLREASPMLTLRSILQSGQIGQVRTLSFQGQHPLRYDTRASWYFEEDNHGGTINDIGIHAFDLAEWLTGESYQATLHARSWNAKAKKHAHFLDSAQMLGTLSDGTGVLADFSYLAPDGIGYALSQYWRIIAHGDRGFAETSFNSRNVQVVTDGDTEPQIVPLVEARPGDHLKDFLAEINGHQRAEGLTTEKVLRLSEHALNAQKISQE